MNPSSLRLQKTILNKTTTKKFLKKNPLINQLTAVQEIAAANFAKINLVQIPIDKQSFDKDPLDHILNNLSPIISRQCTLTGFELIDNQEDKYKILEGKGHQNYNDFGKNFHDRQNFKDFIASDPDPNRIAAFLTTAVRDGKFNTQEDKFRLCLRYIHRLICQDQFHDLNMYLLCKTIPNVADFPSNIEEKFALSIKDLKIDLHHYGFDNLIKDDATKNKILKKTRYDDIINQKYFIKNIMSKTTSNTIHEFQSSLFRNYTSPKWNDTSMQIEKAGNFKYRNFKNVPLNYLEFQNLAISEIWKVGRNWSAIRVKNVDKIQNIEVLQKLLAQNQEITNDNSSFYNHNHLKMAWADFYFKLLVNSSSRNTSNNRYKNSPGRMGRDTNTQKVGLDLNSDYVAEEFSELFETQYLDKKLAILEKWYDQDFDLIIDLPNVCYLLDPKSYLFNSNDDKTSSSSNNQPEGHAKNFRYSKTASFANPKTRESFIEWLSSIKDKKIGFRHFPTLHKNVSKAQFGRGYQKLEEILESGNNKMIPIDKLLANESDDLAVITASIFNHCPYLTFDEYRDWDLWFQYHVEDEIRDGENKGGDNGCELKTRSYYDSKNNFHLTDELINHYRYYSSMSHIIYHACNNAYDLTTKTFHGPSILLENSEAAKTLNFNYDLEKVKSKILPNLPKPDLFFLDYKMIEKTPGFYGSYTDALIFDEKLEFDLQGLTGVERSSVKALVDEVQDGKKSVFYPHLNNLKRKDPGVTTQQYYTNLNRKYNRN